MGAGESLVASLLTSALYDMIKAGSAGIVDLMREGGVGLNKATFQSGYVTVAQVSEGRADGAKGEILKTHPREQLN